MLGQRYEIIANYGFQIEKYFMDSVFFCNFVLVMEQILSLENKNKVLGLVSAAKNVVCVGHVNPDGDALGSTLMVMHWMRRIGKHATVVMPNRFPDFLAAIPGASEVLTYDNDPTSVTQALSHADLIWVCDHSRRDRTRELEDVLAACTCPRIMVDHHLDPENYCDVQIVRHEACAACELLCRMMAELGEMSQMTMQEAECLYCGMMTDTGVFTYNSNRSEVYECISLLIEKGIDKDLLYRRLFWTMTPNRLRLQGYLLYSKLQVVPGLNAAYMTLNNMERKLLGSKNGDTEGIVNMPLQIQGMKFSALMSQDTECPSQYRISLRSVDDFPCNEMAERFFQGGGHRNASGGKFAGTEEEVIEQMKKAIAAYAEMLK